MLFEEDIIKLLRYYLNIKINSYTARDIEYYKRVIFFDMFKNS